MLIFKERDKVTQMTNSKSFPFRKVFNSAKENNDSELLPEQKKCKLLTYEQTAHLNNLILRASSIEDMQEVSELKDLWEKES